MKDHLRTRCKDRASCSIKAESINVPTAMFSLSKKKFMLTLLKTRCVRCARCWSTGTVFFVKN